MKIFRLSSILSVLFFVATLGCYTFIHTIIYSQHFDIQHRSKRDWRTPSFALQILAGEFKGIMSDLLIMETGAYLGTEVKRINGQQWEIVAKDYDWQKVVRMIKHSISLDPYFQQTYMVAQGWLPWDAKMVHETQDILEISRKHRTWDWHPTHFMGFNMYYFLNKPGEAGKLFLEAAKIPNAPHFLAIVGARLAHKGGETQAAISLMESMISNRKGGDTGYEEITMRLKALEGVLKLERSLKKFENITGRFPEKPEDLVSYGVIDKLPHNPYNLSYCIDKSGKIYFDKPNCRELN